MAAPFEIVAAPLTVWVAPVGTAFPATNAAPAVAWIQLGTSGTKNYDSKGVTVTHGSTEATFTPAGGTAPRKVWRTDESLTIDFDLVDLTPEQYAKILGDATVTTTVGPPNTKDIPLLQGLTVKLLALVARGTSSVNDALISQYQIPICYQAANPALVYSKGAPAVLSCSFTALEDATLGFGKLLNQIA